MPQDLRLSINNQFSQLKKAWIHASKQQKITLGILTFVVVVLPLSLIVLKTQTNLFPKATYPVTPPISSPLPSPILPSPYPGTPWPSPILPSPYPGTPWPSPILPSPYPGTPPPSPILPSPYPGKPISLDGEVLPEDPRITWYQLNINYALLQNNPNILSLTGNYTSSGPSILPIEDGYGQFYIIHPTAGKKLEALVRELDISTNGSYIKTVLYGPDKKKIIEAGTRISFTTENTGPYYLVAYTFDHKQGWVEITVNDEFRKSLFPYIKLIDKNMELLWDNYAGPGYRLGRKAVDFFLQVPQLDDIKENYIVYKHQTDQNTIQVEVPRAIMNRTCPSNNQSVSVPITIERMGHYELDPLRKIQMKIYPQSPPGTYFPPGYDYTIYLEYPNPNIGWTASFSTTSQSGLMADLNDDSAVDISDYSLLVSEFMQSNNFLVADLNCDELVDISDYSLLIQNISL
ncbi:hypothetical protein KJ707_03290 [Patescibacteria group bacterium]|nr:hypothetical protein [Patescibacteria group bacterium]